ncbi:hypothetical protein GCM10010435_73920 [Winogradskya consettensis]|uniref:Uncharacterized protein n=1 Tax=Winogradskya consettensis TaxID=113560 RepID=A0A919SLQ7_9ACTN|nr:hypothetical protein [Actinoplanes consettensis]GIM75105.1 hypothetical protein Aco04nite_43660 [Actinoplanes consettensis]
MWPGDRMMPPPLARGRAGAGPLRLRLMTGLALAASAALLVTVVMITDRGPEVESPVGDVVRVGVVDGQSVSGYLRSSRGELGAMFPSAGPPSAGDTWALVSLTGYLGPDKLLGVLGDSAVAQVYARAPLPGVRTQVVKIPVYRMPQDVVAGMLNAALARDQEQADYRKLSGELEGDGTNELRVRQAYDNAAQIAAAEAAAFRAHCACVFAAVVRAGPAVLDRIAGRAEVRVVDPAPEVRQLDRTEFRPVLPEQTTTVPDDDEPSGPVPSRSTAVAPQSPAPLPSSTGARVTSPSPDGPGTGADPSAAAPEESAAVTSASPTGPAPDQQSASSGASRGASGR